MYRPFSLRRKLQVIVPLSLLAIASSQGCATESTAQFIAGIQSQVQVPRDLKTVLLRVKVGGTEQFCQGYNVVNGVVNLPQSLGTINRQDTNLPVEIAVIGISSKTAEDIADCSFVYSQAKEGSDVRVLRRTTQTYVEGRKLYVPMPLRYSCFDKFCDSDDQTCKGGVCTTLPDPRAFAATLVDFRDDLLLGKDNLCFPIGPQKDDKGTVIAAGCFATGLPPKVIDDATCTFEVQEIPGVPFVGVNVQANYEAGFLKEVLDLDQEEGFFIPDPKLPKRFRLAAGLCKAYHGDPSAKHPITGLLASATCAPKTILQPICAGDASTLNPPGNPDVGGGGKTLVPTKGGLTFLLDTTQGNQNFNEGGLAQKIVDVALKDPSLKTLTFGLITLPRLVNTTCPTDASAFDLVPSAAQTTGLTDLSAKLTSFIGANSVNLRPRDSGVKLGLSAAIKNAAGQLKALKVSNVTDRNALVFIGNGSFDSTCDGGSNAKTAAADAFNDPSGSVPTYMVRTDGQFKAEADEISNAGGGGNSYEATGANGAVNALDAFATVTASLTTCRYNEPETKEGEAPSVNNKAPIEYFDPTTLKSVTVPFAAACTGNAGSWSREGGKVVLCADACATLRSTYKKNILTSAVTGAAPVGIPLFLRAPKS